MNANLMKWYGILRNPTRVEVSQKLWRVLFGLQLIYFDFPDFNIRGYGIREYGFRHYGFRNYGIVVYNPNPCWSFIVYGYFLSQV